ncbi:S-methyl-5-thioribose kinase [Leucobacter chromiireducens]|uniref:S-methyl-5-thioribose kinase n=1 Tax=Leucobacter chromiireducens TaxID=283877 RepID=UPI000F63792A|nr:S-methyl-5-thioribose kinase [Leucobacter chromiireducens]
MSNEYTFLDADNIAAYLRSRPETHDRIDADRIASVREIGDGNLNLVFHVVDADERGIILKQALPYVRMVGAGWPMTPERAAREADSLATHHALTPELVVEVIAYDPERYIIVLEDLSDHAVWRDALNRSERHEDVARRLGEYVAALAVGTSVLGQDRLAVAGRIAETQNPELCTITEDLVFTEPVFDTGRNEVLPENAADAAALAADPAFAAAMAEAKWRFMTQAEALIHGDLHTGSVMVRGADGAVADSVKVFDSEFAFYGPIAFDLGALFANYAFAAARATALGEHERAAWALGLVTETWDAFAASFTARAAEWHEVRLFGAAFAARRLDRIRREALLFASAKMARRIVGAAKVRDIESLEPALRAPAARSVLAAARAVAAGWDEAHDVSVFTDLVGAEILAK